MKPPEPIPITADSLKTLVQESDWLHDLPAMVVNENDSEDITTTEGRNRARARQRKRLQAQIRAMQDKPSERTVDGRKILPVWTVDCK